MNTIGSVYYGWAFLILCGGGSYYFAKRSVNRDRYERKQMDNERRYRQQQMLEASSRSSGSAHPPNTTSPTSSSRGMEGGIGEPGGTHGGSGGLGKAQ